MTDRQSDAEAYFERLLAAVNDPNPARHGLNAYDWHLMMSTQYAYVQLMMALDGRQMEERKRKEME